ncbi:2-isopropylmalate synthase [Ktedonospora formicarum]|uniref:2-isopropylmalate synthase n=1 Tax=Ktedonospora formicarum TaxID=2778364 RepID=A0A8J3I3Q0_9CHLR|nr:2-isopropylmalate synthase [Ktedonospora formicarum]GHO45423.1 hypothetical protein KSX_35860 [Ktedonospora formicarum]
MGTSEIVAIFDTTLRDGAQSPGAAMTIEEKIRVADQLVALQVDVIEAGFPASSPDDMASVREIARRVKGVAVAALARAVTSDIDMAWEAVREAERPIIHVSLATSDIHLQHKLRISREEALQRAKTMVARARSYCPTVEFSAEDATRSDRDFLCRLFEVVISEGATIINVPDTVGYTMPGEYEDLFRYLRAHVQGIEHITLSAHCHDDLGMATANTLAATRGGARQVEVTINGIGERAGNTALEEIVMALRTRYDAFHIDTRVKTEYLLEASQMLSQFTGIPVQPNKAIVGLNAFTHQDGVLKHRQTYEIMNPQSIGWGDMNLVLGKHSGRHGLDARLRLLGYRLSAEQLKEAYKSFVAMAEQQKAVSDDALIYIAECMQETPSAV